MKSLKMISIILIGIAILGSGCVDSINNSVEHNEIRSECFSIDAIAEQYINLAYIGSIFGEKQYYTFYFYENGAYQLATVPADQTKIIRIGSGDPFVKVITVVRVNGLGEITGVDGGRIYSEYPQYELYLPDNASIGNGNG